MISLFPIGRVITYIAVAYSFVPAIVLYFSWSTGNTQTIYSTLKTALAGSGALSVIIFLFFTSAWRLVWKWIPGLNTAIFPDLNGQWDMRIEWNRGGKSGEAQAIAIIRQDFLKISMEVHSADSDSETLLAQPKKDAELGRPSLYYVYRVIPKRTAGKGDPPYDGTAVLKLSPDRASLQGNYFTDARTQGHFQLTRPGRANAAGS